MFLLQGVYRPNTTPIAQDRKYKDLQSLALTSTSLRDLLFYTSYEERDRGHTGKPKTMNSHQNIEERTSSESSALFILQS